MLSHSLTIGMILRQHFNASDKEVEVYLSRFGNQWPNVKTAWQGESVLKQRLDAIRKYPN